MNVEIISNEDVFEALKEDDMIIVIDINSSKNSGQIRCGDLRLSSFYRISEMIKNNSLIFIKINNKVEEKEDE